jgi:hypothetical protein
MRNFIPIPGEWGSHFECNLIGTTGSVTPLSSLLENRALEIRLPDDLSEGLFVLSVAAHDVQQQIRVKLLLVRQ